MADQPMSLPEIIAADIPAFLVESSKAGQSNAELARQAAEKLRSSESLYRELAQQDVIVQEAQNAAKLKAQQQTIQTAKAAGVDGSANDALIQLISDSSKVTDEVRKNLAEYRKQNEVSIWENPTDWIKAQFTLPDTQAKLEGSINEAKIIDSRIAQVNNQIQNSAQTRATVQEPLTAVAAAASAKKVQLLAELEANRLALDALKYDSAAINAIQEASKDRIGMLFQARSAAQAEQQLSLALQKFEQDKKEFDFNSRLREDALAAKAEGKRIDEVSLRYINASRRSLGLPDMTSDEFQSAAKLGLPDLKYHYENGTRVIATGSPSIATNPADALEVLSSLPTNLPDVRGETAKKVYEIAQEYLNGTAEGKMVDRKDKEKVKSFVNKAVNTQLANDYADIKPGSMFDVGDLSSYFGMAAIKNLPVTQKLLGPAAAAKQPLNDAKQVMGLVVAGVRNGTITTSEAQDIATIYQGASLLNQRARGFQSLGIQLPNAGRNYRVTLPTGMLSAKSSIDLTNPTEVGRWLSKELAKETYRDQFRVDNTAKPLLPGKW